MTVALRIILLVVSLITAFFVMQKIKRSQFTIGDTLYWIMFCAVLLLLSAFPKISYFLSGLFGFITTANFVFVTVIFLLLIKVFLLDIKVSTLQNKLYTLTQKYSLDNKKDNK